MRLSLYEFQTGAETIGGDRVVYDVANDDGRLRRGARSTGHALVWQLDDTPEEAEGALLSRRIQLDPFAEWVCAATGSTSRPAASPTRTPIPGPGIRYLLHGELDIDTEGRTASYGPGGAWFESGPDPVLADGVAAPADGLRARARPAGRVGRQAHDPLRRSRRRGPPEAAEADRLPRAPRSRLRVRTGGRLLVDQLVVHGVDLAFGVPGESYLAVLDALHDAPIRFVACRHEVGAANMADAYGKLTGRPGICMVTRGPGRDARRRRRPHRLPGLDAADPPDRPGRPRDDGARGVPGDRLPPDVRADGEVGGADRRSRPDPRARLARVPRRHLGPPGSGRARAAGGHARRGVRRRRRAAVTRQPRPSGAGATSSARARLLAGAERPLVVVGGAPWSAEAHDALTALVRARAALPVAVGLALAGLRRQHARDVVRRPPRRSAPTRASPQRVRDADVAARDRRPAERDHDRGLHAARACPTRRRRSSTSPPTPTSSAASTRRRSQSPPRPTRSRARSRRCRRSSRRALAGGDAAGARRTTSTTSAALPDARRRSTWAR